MTDAFSPKEILYDNEMLNKIEEGVKAVHDAVGSTMGPHGQLVMFEEEKESPYPIITKDGVTVASMLAFKDKAVNNGAQFVIQAARRQVHETGDGTTLTSILTYKIFEEGRKLLTARYSPNDIIDGIKKAVNDVVQNITDQAVKDLNLDDLRNIAKVSTNNDTDLSEKIAEAVHKTGKLGMVFHERAYQEHHEVEYQDGYQIDTGIKVKEFANINGTLMSLKNPYVLVTDQKLVDANKLYPITKKIAEKNKKEGIEGKPELVIVSPSIGGDLMQVMKRNIVAEDGMFFLCHIIPCEDFKPEKNKFVLEDIAALTGAFFVSEDSGYQVQNLTLEQLGTCESIVSTPNKTLFSGYNSESVSDRIKHLEELKEITKNDNIKSYAEISLAKLTGGVATIKIGGKNITEQTETLFRVDDAVQACKSAQEMGYVRGGGVSMLIAYKDLINKEKDSVGYKCFLECLKYPTEKILTNAKYGGYQGIITNIIESKSLGYDMKEDFKDTDMYLINIVDPVKVIVYAIKNAASVAISMLQTGAMIIEKE